MLTNAHRPCAHTPVRDFHHPTKFPPSRAPSPLVSLGAVFGDFLYLRDCGPVLALPVGQRSSPGERCCPVCKPCVSGPVCDVGHKRLLNWWTKGKVTGLSGYFFLLFGDHRHANEMTELLTEVVKQLRKKSKKETAVCFCGLLRSPNSCFLDGSHLSSVFSILN